MISCLLYMNIAYLSLFEEKRESQNISNESIPGLKKIQGAFMFIRKSLRTVYILRNPPIFVMIRTWAMILKSQGPEPEGLNPENLSPLRKVVIEGMACQLPSS